MRILSFIILASASLLTAAAEPKTLHPFSTALTMHASFDKEIHADFSKGDRFGYVRKGKENVKAESNEEAKIAQDAGKFGGALWFPKKGNFRPQFNNALSLIHISEPTRPY